MKVQSKENNSFYYIQDIIDTVMREAFRVRMTPHELKEHQSKNNYELWKSYFIPSL